MASKIAQRREHSGDFAKDQAQRLAQQVAQRVNRQEDQLADLDAKTVSLMLARDFTTTLATATSTPLSFPVKKDECWDVEFWGYGACSNTTGMKYALYCPAGSVASGEIESSSSNTSVANWTTDNVVANALLAATHVGASFAGRPDRFNARVKVAVDGNVTLQVASVTAGATTLLRAKAYLRATRVQEV